ncbi:MAG: hypothetical protein HY318_10765 [Armatimonadetes bacterium]|nr:hypothetical protein [Armatimonadota bacterium]
MRPESMRAGEIPFPLLAFAVCLLSFAVLVYEVSLTRLFSVVLRYHFVFLVTSVAVCGLGLGGLILHQCQRWVARLSPQVFLVLNLCGFALTIPVAIGLILLWLLPNYPTCYWGVAALILIPFLFAGAFLAYAFQAHGARCGQLYGADLLGAALAAGAVILLLKHHGAINTCFAAGSYSGLCALLLLIFRQPRSPLRNHSSGWLWLAIVALLLNQALIAANHRMKFLDIPPLKTDDSQAALEISKPLFRELADPEIGAKIVQTDWSAFARTDVVEEKDAPDTKYIWTDGEVPTHMEKFDGDLKKVEFLKAFIGYLPYQTKQVKSALSIGPGGGLDILLGLLAKTSEIDGVEVNASIPRIMRQYADFNGGIYEQPNVHITVGDGRTYVRHATKRYDLIYLALTQTAAYGNVGLSLVESYIHTTDALRDYLGHVTPGGRVALITQEYSLLCRYFATAVQVLGERGESAAEACRHIALFSVPVEQYGSTPYRNLALVQNSPYTPEEAGQLQAFARRMRLTVYFIPHLYEGRPFCRVASGALSLSEFINLFRKHEEISIKPVNDNSPFFVDLSLATPQMLTHLLLGALVLIAAFSAWAGASVYCRSRRGERDSNGVSTGQVLPFVFYFSALGSGFMLVEIALAQKMILFLGYPTLALSVILCALLLGGGCGSWFSQRVPPERLHRGIVVGATGVVALVLLEAQVVHLLFESANIPSIALRSLLSVLLLLPLGFFLGIPFPSGIRLLERVSPEDIPWMWGVNGVTSVIGSVLAAIGAKLWGFNQVLWLGSCVYGLIAVIFLVSDQRKRTRNEAPSTPSDTASANS